MKVNDLKTTLEQRIEALETFIEKVWDLTAQGLTYTQIAKKLNFERNTLYSIINWKRVPSLKKLEELNKKL